MSASDAAGPFEDDLALERSTEADWVVDFAAGQWNCLEMLTCSVRWRQTLQSAEERKRAIPAETLASACLGWAPLALLV